jgi:putative spermidine/putrescine transport system ATP-binding protein
MRAEIRRIHSRLDRATVYVTHDQDEALSMADRIVDMREGVVQQVGTPKEVYGRPTNLHVARFMGYRNVHDCRIVQAHNDRASVDANGVSLTGMRISPFPGPQAQLAIRPEDFQVCESGAPNSVQVRIESVEYGGRDSLLILGSAIGPIYARIAGEFEPGQTLCLHVPPDKAIVYEGSPA